MNLEDYIKDLDPVLQERARACGSAGELLALAREEGVPLPDGALAAIAGGDGQDPENCSQVECPRCGSTNVGYFSDGTNILHKCRSCGYEWGA